MFDRSRSTTTGLIGVTVGLLAVGVVSGTPVRHLIQVTPVVAALVVALRGATWSRFAALPVFAFWLLIMVAIWLYLLGVASIVSGRFTPSEVCLTVVIGVSCLVGLSQTFRGRCRPTVGVLATLAFAALQIAAMWLSLRPALAAI